MKVEITQRELEDQSLNLESRIKNEEELQSNVSKTEIIYFLAMLKTLDNKIMNYFSKFKNYNAQLLNISSKSVIETFAAHKRDNNNSQDNLLDGYPKEVLCDDKTVFEIVSVLTKHYNKKLISSDFFNRTAELTQPLVNQDINLEVIINKGDDNRILTSHSSISGKNYKSHLDENNSQVKFLWSDFGGYHKAVEKLKEIAFFIKNYEKIKNMVPMERVIPKGILLYGPPGTGKTFLSKVFCDTSGILCERISASDIASTYSMGLTLNFIAHINKLMQDALRKGKSFYMLYIDEIDSVAVERGSTNSIERDSFVNTLNSYMDGPNYRDGLMFMASTNRINSIDSALIRPNRFVKIELSKPTKDEIKEIISAQIRFRKRTSTQSCYKGDLVKHLESFVDEFYEEDWTGAFVSQLFNNLERKLLKNYITTGTEFKADYDALVSTMKAMNNL